ncbi:MAG: phytanoyl-CoA dioxygenase family protein [Acidimicrobiales bacterium]
MEARRTQSTDGTAGTAGRLAPEVERDLHRDLAVDADDVTAFDRDGFVRLRGILDPATIDGFASIVAEAAEQSAQHQVPMERRSVYSRAFVQEMNLWQRIADIRPLVFSRTLGSAAAALLGVPAVRLYHDQALVKEAHGGRTPWHCDQYYWPLDTDRVVTAWIPLHDVPSEQGPLAFAVGSHRIDLGRELDISEESEQKIFRHQRWSDLPIDTSEAAAGDVTFHQGWTFHGADPNDTDGDRLVMTMIYFADGARLIEPTTGGQHLDRQIWLPDSEVGRPIDSWLSPVVWSEDPSAVVSLADLPAPGPFLGTFDLGG